MKERLPAFIALFLLLGLVLTTWWAADYAQRAVPVDPPAKITHEPDAWMGRFVMFSSDEHGNAINRLEGDTLRHYPDDDSYEVDNAHMIGQHPGNPRTTGSADLAIMLDNNTKVIMRGNAHLYRFPTEQDSQLDVKSEELIIYPDKDIITTDKPADVVQGNSRMKGRGMNYNNATRLLEVYSNTDLKISPDDLNANKEKTP